MKLSVIIPVYNEEKTVYSLLTKVIREKTAKEIIIVDDGSTDQTSRLVKRFIQQYPAYQIQLCRHSKNRGKGAAIRTGFKRATGDVLIIQDADLEYDPKDYQRLLKPLVSNKCQVVYGSRLRDLRFRLLGPERTPFPLHYLANRFLSFLTNLLYGSQLTDMETCYKMLTREVYQSLKLTAHRFDIEPEITAKILQLGYKIAEIPISTKPRSYQDGKKIRARDAVQAVWVLFKYWRTPIELK